MKLYTVVFKHTKTKQDYTYTYTDWTIVDGSNVNEAKAEARRWIREYRSDPGYRNHISFLKVTEIR